MNRAWFAYLCMATIITMFGYLLLMSPFGVVGCSTNTVRCLFPDYETGVTRLGSSDATVASEVFWGLTIMFWFIIPFLVELSLVLREVWGRM